MPIFKKLNIDKLEGVIWKIAEEVEWLQQHTFLSLKSMEKFNTFSSKKRKKEFLAIRKCFEVLGITDEKVYYSNTGKPYVKDSDLYISISHSEDFAAVVISDETCGGRYSDNSSKFI